MVSSCSRRVSAWLLGKKLLQNSGQALEQVPQGRYVVTTPGGVQEEGRCGTEG